ncbi:MAG: rod-binding protein [Paracoccaceae bacterium]|tara:strand:- start:773 stop:1117 length:345 start_codon:yes stop_codon:yes gene_type:complete
MTDISNINIGNSALIGKTQLKSPNEFKDFVNSDKISDKNEDLQIVANQFEAIFLEMLLKQARDSKLSDGLFDTKSDDNFVQMFDAELAKSSSESVDIGIAEAIIKQMSFHGSES